VFLAVELAAEVSHAIAQLKRTLAAIPSRVRWVRDEGLHATVKFLGSTGPDQLAALREVLTPAVEAYPRFDMRAAGLGVFPDLGAPRVVWVGLHGARFDGLARLVEKVAAGVGYPPEKRPFRGHLTLGRVRGTRGWREIERVLRANRNEEFGAMRVAELVAFRSDLRPAGAVYTKLWTTPLGRTTREESDGSG